MLLFLLAGYMLFSQSLAQQLFSTENRLKFGESLFSERDYLRAIDEFTEVLKKRDNDTTRFKVAESLFRIGRFDESAINFKTLIFSRTLEDNSKLYYFKTLFLMQKYSQLLDHSKMELYRSKKYDNEINTLASLSQIYSNNFVKADTAQLFAPFPESVHSTLSNFYIRAKSPRLKSKTKAALYSAFLPGAGKIYTGEISDGITTFITTALLTYLAVSNFNAKHEFRGWLFTGLTSLFYAGNIYGAAASASIYNAQLRYNLDSEIKSFFESNDYFLPKIGFSEQ
jgi:TM2 domain-containing membrane protein YozV